MNVAALLDAAALVRPDHDAIVHEGKRSSYRALAQLAARIAGGLAAEGVGPGSRVALCCTNRPGFVAAYFGILKTGACVVLLATNLRETDLAEQLRAARVDALLVYDGLAEEASLAQWAAPNCRRLWLIPRDPLAVAGEGPALCDLMRGQRDAFPTVERPPDATAAILFTSGTTGKPSGVELSHANLLAMTTINRFMAAPEVEPRRLVANALYHIMGLMAGLHVTVLAASTMVLVEGFDPQRIWRVAAEQRITFMGFMPAHYRDLLDAADSVDVHAVAAHVRLCATGGGPLNPALAEAWEARVGCPLTPGYGMTETTSLITWHPPAAPIRAGSVGCRVPGIALKLIDRDWNEVPAGEAGEIAVRSPGVMTGYLDEPERNAETMKNGWFRTSDLGHIDAAGYVFLDARLDGKVIQGHEHIYPSEVRRVLSRHPAIGDCAFLAGEHLSLGEELVVVVEPKVGVEEPSAEAVKRWLEAEMPEGKCPGRVVMASRLPRTAIGKIDISSLKQYAELDGLHEA
ncbi:MAG: class I adenylate-forming enzyme family protein [Kiloniellales bacterium]